ncbi:hypothetical protein AAFF_G00408110 [Aldrovandia affinis]|uniref:Uncharacterized protein n=1 Tax=Aldrovandia affinis TaxID=143900 RepID=A0AAD7SBS5_9TELE|nr:hypothetical protein AAFF_G00408110 [Aldrovandia affinis]
MCASCSPGGKMIKSANVNRTAKVWVAIKCHLRRRCQILQELCDSEVLAVDQCSPGLDYPERCR